MTTGEDDYWTIRLVGGPKDGWTGPIEKPPAKWITRVEMQDRWAVYVPNVPFRLTRKQMRELVEKGEIEYVFSRFKVGNEDRYDDASF